MFPSLQMIGFLEQKTEMLFGHWREGGEERRGEVRVGEGWGVGFSVS